MKTDFPILPWEYRGADFTPTPHAFAQLEVGGKKRHFALKTREGVIYFKEPAHSTVYAVPRLFAPTLHNDAEALVSEWTAEITDGNYGQFIARPLHFPGISATTVLAIIHRADGSGWIREWFDSHWLETPPHRDGKRLELWGAQSFHAANRRAIRSARPKMLGRTLPADKRRDIPRRWIAGDETDARDIVPQVLRLFAPQMGHYFRDSDIIPLELQACCPGSNGSFNQYSPSSRYFHFFPISPHLRRALKLLQRHMAFEELTWTNHTDVPPKERAAYFRSEEILTGIEQWGPDWRGNFSFSVGKLRFDLEPFAPPTSHEKLESLLVFRDWLENKVTPAQCAALLKSAQA